MTTTKQDVTALPLKTLREICHAVQIPVVAIGGVSAENIDQLVGCDVAGVAVYPQSLRRTKLRQHEEAYGSGEGYACKDRNV